MGVIGLASGLAVANAIAATASNLFSAADKGLDVINKAKETFNGDNQQKKRKTYPNRNKTREGGNNGNE